MANVIWLWSPCLCVNTENESFFSRAPVGTYCTSHLFYLLFLPKLSPCRFCPLISTLLCASSPHPPPAPASPWHPPSQPFPLCSLDFWFHGQQAYTLGHHPGGSLHFPPPQRLCLSLENTDASPFQAEGVNPPFPTKPRARKGLAFFHFLIAVSKPWLLHWQINLIGDSMPPNAFSLLPQVYSITTYSLPLIISFRHELQILGLYPPPLLPTRSAPPTSGFWGLYFDMDIRRQTVDLSSLRICLMSS